VAAVLTARRSATVAEGFLGRWAQRKAQARQGLPLEEPTAAAGASAVPAVPSQAPSTNASPGAGTLADGQPAHDTAPTPTSVAPEVPPLTLQDAQALTSESDFKPFMAQGVAPEVKNAAMKKLFTDPHYNVMDRMDIYIDDYNLSEPIPESMLRNMASAKFLNLFEEDLAEPVPQAVAHNVAPAPTMPTHAVTEPQALVETFALSSTPEHDHPDLRLQPEHATPAPEAGRGTK